MTLEAGIRLGSYEILSPLGAGGMGEVYRARDTRLGREVAIKLLLDEVSADAERLVRFEREARVLASLNHPHIATLHGFERDGDTHFLVMELVEGSTLADRIARGPISIAQAIPIFVQIAEGLEAAHEKGVVHRDLKPANIKLARGTAGGPERVKILDFGLAKAMESAVSGVQAAAADGALSQSPTLSIAATQRGEILGTAAYMSPEQARGDAVDKRTDVWAFGCCLYEALTGSRAFGGASSVEVLSRVLQTEPDWARLRSRAGARLERLVRACLAKEPALRLRDVGDAQLELRGVHDTAAESRVAAPPARSVARWLVPIAAGGLSLLLGASAARWLAEDPTPSRGAARPLRFSINLPVEYPLRVPPRGNPDRGLVISPDGEWLVYVTSRNALETVLVKRRLDGTEFEPIPGTEGANTPFFSPDGAWVAFASLPDDKLKRVSIEGGSPVDICEIYLDYIFGGGVWDGNGDIYFGRFAAPAGVYRVASSGGRPELVAPPDLAAGEGWRASPETAGDALLVTSGAGPEFGRLEVHALDLDTGREERLLQGASRPRYLPSQRAVLFAAEAGLMAVPFDPARFATTGRPENVTPSGMSGWPVAWSISDDGILVFAEGARVPGNRLHWLRPDGRTEGIAGLRPLPDWARPALAADGRRIAYTVVDERGASDIFVFDLVEGSERRLTFEVGRDLDPAWTPDGRSLVFTSERDGIARLYLQPVDGSGPAVRLAQSPHGQRDASFGPDGTLLFVETTEVGDDIRAVDLRDPARGVRSIAESDQLEQVPALSPDGRWLAYLKGPSQRAARVYVQPFPALDATYQVPDGPGEKGRPTWSPEGDALYYVTTEGVFSVEVRTEPAFSLSRPRLFIPGSFDYWTGATPVADRFLVAVPPEQEPVTELHVIVDWFEELNRLLPTG